MFTEGVVRFAGVEEVFHTDSCDTANDYLKNGWRLLDVVPVVMACGGYASYGFGKILYVLGKVRNSSDLIDRVE